MAGKILDGGIGATKRAAGIGTDANLAEIHGKRVMDK
jgi:hypothetical protein